MLDQRRTGRGFGGRIPEGEGGGRGNLCNSLEPQSIASFHMTESYCIITHNIA